MGGRTDGRTEDRTNWNDDDDADSIVHMSEGERETSLRGVCRYTENKVIEPASILGRLG